MTPALLQRRSERAFERMYETHVRDVYRYALAVTGNQPDAEDVTQTTFMNAYRAMERGERPEKPKNWLISITHNVCRQRFRQAARRPKEVAYEEDVAEALVPSVDSPTATDIQRALGHLALNQREALVMRELEGRSYAEIAEVLGLTVSAVETLLFRARRALREQLEGSLTCSEAEAALSRQLDGRLSREEAGSLRAHLRECETCRHLARTQRAQRKSFQALAAVPLPPSLASWLGGGAASVGAGVGAGAGASVGAGMSGLGGLGVGLAAKAAAVTAAVAVAGGGSYAIVKHETGAPRHPTPPTVTAPVVPAAPAKAPATSTKSQAAAAPSSHSKKKKAAPNKPAHGSPAAGASNGHGAAHGANGASAQAGKPSTQKGKSAAHTPVAKGHTKAATPTTAKSHASKPKAKAPAKKSTTSKSSRTARKSTLPATASACKSAGAPAGSTLPSDQSSKKASPGSCAKPKPSHVGGTGHGKGP